MDYKEKYEQALERARMINNGEDVDVEAGTTTCEYIFPELKESEDERIRKELIGFLQLPHPQFVGERKQEKWIAWLEKQGEKKPIEWSEEDDIIFDEVINNLHNYIFKSDNTYSYIDCDKHITWLKSLKQRIGG